jgi:hypothetical protein
MSTETNFKNLSDVDKKAKILAFLDEAEPDYAEYLEAIFDSLDLAKNSDSKLNLRDNSEDFKSASFDKQSELVLEFLKSKTDYMKTIDIAKNFYGPKGTSKDINPLLYKLQSKKQITKTCNENGTEPKWKV